ncbi:sensor histidine kinase [Amycolatopsis aidingensis]|uniref:sensor histidine kinase n=1 Tax=Amycolatopsis aidingensis TaxID=2842453 RepID=UPI001C0CF659|nr:histidine kinase [Amycolatopsis aidingensis]
MPDTQPATPFPQRLSHRKLMALDLAAAIAYTAILVLSVLRGTPPGAQPPAWAACLIAAGIGLPIALRRLWPRWVFAWVLVCSALGLGLGAVREPMLAAAYALYLVALTEPAQRWMPTRMIAVISVTAALLLPLMAGAPGERTPRAATLIVGVVALGIGWTLGRAVRDRRASTALAAERLAGQAVTEERLRIARELHDIVTHGMGVIAVKAGVARHVLHARPEADPAAREALRDIENAGRNALTELRRMLGVLRSQDPASDPDATLHPRPGLGSLAELTGQLAAAGIRTEVDVRGVDRLPESVDLTAYRIVQEALTNVLKHAGAAHCAVTVDADDAQVWIEVTDDGGGAGPGGSRPGGSGLIGVHERVLMYRGEFAAGPRPEGGFAVSARLPYTAVAANGGRPA